jgi:CRP/FNR family cyclic AMP-dependent transcriptional regulator
MRPYPHADVSQTAEPGGYLLLMQKMPKSTRDGQSARAVPGRNSLQSMQGAGTGVDPDERPSLQMLMRRSWDRPTEGDWADVLDALPLFAGLRKRQLRGIAKSAKVVDYASAEPIVQAGEPGDSFYLLLEGRARVAGKSRTLKPGDFFGEMALVDGGPRSATITATSPVRAMKLPRKAFLKALKQDPQMGLVIMETLAGRVRRLERGVSA